MSLKRSATAINWANEGFTDALGLTDQEDGEANTQKMRESGIAANIPILEYCKDGWYLPARMKWKRYLMHITAGLHKVSG